jgi:Domain of Unknown Function (DUF1080)/PA14 domain
MLRERKPLLALLCTVLACTLFSQNYKIPMTALSLDDMSAFKPQAGNWQLVSDVTMDRQTDVHEKGNQSVITKAGKGIIVNLNDATKKDALLSSWEHGDIDIELEFMMPKGSNSGIYLQGRYEVQLYDSWGAKSAKFSDLGGIYRNWEREKGKIYMGKAPLSNAAKAPGLWQTLYISFRAPRFDAMGKKIANARMARVDINGVTIHENVEIPLPTGGPIENNEKPLGPLMIQGDHGAVAFKNIKYRLYKPEKVTLNDLSYQYWDGKYEFESEYKAKTPTKTGKIVSLNYDFINQPDTFGVRYTGKINVPQEGAYFFTLQTNGGSVLNIDGKNVITNYRAWNWDVKTGQVELKAGEHTFELFYHRHDTWVAPTIGLFVESAGVEKQGLHNPASFSTGNAVSPIFVRVGSQPKILRAFLDFKNDGKLRRTHTVGVGDPSGVHYIFDNKLGVLSCVWRGDFVDATPMWHDRGDGSFKPLGDVVFLFNTPQLAVLSDRNAAFPTVFTADNFKSKGYKIEENSARPVFKYTAAGLEVEDKTYPDDENRVLTREVKISSGAVANVYFKLAEGKDISNLTDGSFLIDKKYYITVSSNEKPFIRNSNGQKELVVAVNNIVKYSIIW